MASDPGASSCESDPNFAVVCAFLEKFGTSCGLTNIDFVDLQAMLENTEEVPKVLIDLHVKLIRKARKSVAHEKWERVLTKLCYDVFESEDARQLETFGYKNSKLSSKIRILKNLLEMQFDYHNKFKNEINKMSADELRSEPLGRDKLGNTYWFQSDDNYQIRIYKEDSEDETWKLVARDKESLVALISELDGESKLSSDSAANDDSSSLTEKPIMDTGQNDTSSSDLKKTSEESENSSDSKKDEVKEETDGTDVSEKAEDLSLVKDFSSENFEEKLPKLIIKPIEKVENSDKDRVVVEDPSKTATRETKGAEIGEAIEEPVMHVTGEGSGVENETVNPIIGETIEEEVMYIFGEGSGVESMTGNGNDDDKNHDSEKSSTICSERRASNEGESLNDPSNSIINERISKHDVMEIDNNGSEIPSPTKSPYKLGTIIDTKTKTDCKQTIPRPRKSRWDVETTVQIDGEDDCAEAKTDEEEGKSTEDSRVTQTLTPPPPPPSSPPKKQMFFFGPSSTFNSPLNENFCSFGFSPKANKTSQLEGEGEKREAERGDISISVNDSNCEEKKGSDDSALLEEKNPPAESDHNVEHSNHNETKKIDFSTSQLDSAKNDSFEEIAEVNSLLKSESENNPNSKPDTNSTAHHDHEECKDEIAASKDRDSDGDDAAGKCQEEIRSEKSTAADPVEQTPKDDPVELEIKKRPDCEIDTNTDINPSIASQKEDQIVNEHGGAVELLVNEDSLKKIDNKPFRIVDYSSDDDSLSSAGSKVTCIRDRDREENKVSNSGSDLTDVTQSVDRGQGVENTPNNSLENDGTSRIDHVVEKEEKSLAEVSFEEDKCDDRVIETDVGKDSSSEEEEHEKSVQQIEGREKKSPEKEDVIQRVETPEKVNLADVPEEISSEDLSGADPDKNEDVPSVSSHSDEVSTSAKEISVNSIEEPIDMSNISSSKEENEAVNFLDAAEEENVSSKIFNDDTDAVSGSGNDRGSGTKSNKEESENEKEAENPLDDAEQKKVSSKIDEQAGEVHLKTDNEEENGLDVTKQEDASSKIHDDDDDIDMIEESKNDNLLPQPQEGTVCSETETEDQSSLNAAKQEDTSPGILDGVDMINLKSTKEESENIVTEKEAENPLEDAEQKKVSSKIDEQDGGVRLETENEAKSDLDVAKQEDASSKILDDDVDMITIKTSKEESKNEPLPQNEEVVRLEVENKTENPLDDAKAKQELTSSEIIEKNDNNSSEIRNVMSEVETNLEKMFEDNDTDAKDAINAVENDDEKSKSVEEDCTEAILEGTKKESQIILNNQEITAPEKTDKVDKSSPDNDKDEHSDISSDDGCDDVGGADQAYESDNYENEDSAEKNLEEDGGSRKGNICEKEKITVVPLKEEESRIDNKSTTTDIKSVPKTMRLRSKKEVKPAGPTEVDGGKELLSTDKEEVYNCDIQEPDSKRFKANPDKDEVPEESETSLADVAEMKDQVVIPKKQSKKKEKETRSTVRTRQKQREIVTDDPDVVKKTVPENNDKSDNKKRAQPEPVPEEPVEVVNLIDEPEIAPERPKRNHNKKGQNNKIQTTENDNKTNNIEVINKKAKLTKQQPPQATEVRVTRATRSSNKTEPSNATDENVITGRVKNSGLDSTPAPASKKSKKKVKSSNSTPVSGTTPIPSPQTVMSVTLDCENTVGSSSDVEVVQEKDPLAVSESDQESPQSKPMTLSTFSMDFDECAVMISEIPRRVLRKRGREPEDNGPIDIGVGAKKPKLKGKRSVDVQMRKNVEEQKSIEISSSSDEEGDDVGVAEKIKPKGKQMRKSVDEQKCIQIISSEEDNATVVPSAAKKAPKKGKKGKTVAESKTTSSKINTETKPDKEKMIQNRNKRLLANLGINSDDISSLTEVPSVRQSRRIAQIRIKEDAEKTHHKKGGKPDVVKPAKESKESKEYKPEKKKKEKIQVVVESEEEVICIEDSSDIPGKKKRRRKKYVDPRKIFDVRTPWKSSTDESSEENNEVVEEEEYYSEPEEPLKSDHEFSPESDLEEEWKPMKRARTARNESDVEELDDCPCQKCGKSDHPESILLCDQCDKGWHCSCLRPPFFVIPEGDWFCPPCQHVKLLKALQLKLEDYEKKLVKKELEDRRKERLAYVGISLSNVLRGENKRKDDDSDEEAASESASESGSSESDSDEPIYQLRQRRQAHNYHFNDYDELINSAIQDMEAVKGAGNQGRGKDIQTIVNAEKEEEMRRVAGAEKNENEVEPLPPVVPKETIDDAAQPEVEKERVKSRKFGRKKSRKLNSLDVESEDDISDEDFKGSSSEPEDDEDFDEDEVVDSDDSSKRPVRRSTRARTSRYDADFVNDDSSSDERKKKKRMKKPTWYESESEESEGWGKKKKQNSRLKFRPLGKRKLKKKKKKRGDDSDLESYKRKKPKIKYGGLSSEDDAKGRRTRGRKINYVEALGSDDSEEDNKKKTSRRLDSDDEYVGNEEEQEEDEKISEEEAPTEEENEQSSDDQQKKIPKIKMKVKRRAIIESDEEDEEEKSNKKQDEIAASEELSLSKGEGDGENSEMNTSDEHKNLDEMDEAEVEKMMEDEEYANRQLQLVAKQLEKKRRHEQKSKNSLLEKQLEAPMKENSSASHQSSIRLARIEDLRRSEIADPENSSSTCGIDMTMCRNDMDESSIDDFEESLIVNSIDNEDLSEPPGVSLPMFSELASLSSSPRKPRKQGKTKKSIRDALANLELARSGKKVSGARAGPSESPSGSHIEIAAPPQPFAQSEPTPSVITRMLQSEPLTVGAPTVGGSYPVGTIRPKQFAMLTEKEVEDSRGETAAAGLPAPPTGRQHGHGPPHYNMPANQRGPVPYRQLPPVMGYSRGAPPPHFPPHNAAPQPQTPHVFHPHRNMDPSPSGGGPINMSASINMPPTAPLNMSAAVLSQERSSPSKDVPTPPYSRHPPPRGTARPVQGVPPHLIPPQGRGYQMSAGYPAPFSYGPAPMLPSDEAGVPPPPPPPIGYQGPPYQEPYHEEAGGPAGNHGETATGKGYEDELGGEFGGLVSYFSSQREDDLDS